VDNLSTLRDLEADGAAPRRSGARWTSAAAAADAVAPPPDTFRLGVSPGLPLVRADASQLERAFAPPTTAARQAAAPGADPRSGRALARHREDRRSRPGIALAEQERIFEPFYSPSATARAPRLEGSASRSRAASSRSTAGGCGSSRCPGRARRRRRAALEPQPAPRR